ncbi:uncharacterized protein A4U43_C05F1340 [Asparagus officinalis]|uniref:MYND-type domain-containing protein n=1 Tax=Asparagus officinalis TaxID=4686 RepID=A0A5P1EPI0_ASPOF|nr:programmed cell death protein 2 [Asparagus officinalis]ONK67563.1 uncharacterized protein A4U43_C05F1340 [Asparagus officinalis]
MDSDLNNLDSLRITSLDDDEGDEDAIEMDDDDDDGDDEAEDEVAGGGVTLGFVEKPKNPHSLLRQFFPSKAGGVPAWLDPLNLPWGKFRTCGFCGEPLLFLLQIYASLPEKESTFHRILYVFMCPSMSCLLKDQHEQWKRDGENSCRSVKVFRCQLPRSNPFYSFDPPKHNGRNEPLTAGAELCCWCGTWVGDKICSNCRRARYCSEKHQSMHWRSGHKNDCRRLANPSEASVPILGNAACRTLWPEYEIENEDECLSDYEHSEDTSSATSLVPVQNKTDEAFQSLSDKFAADNDKENFASFQQRIAKAPEQVLRYCRDLAAKPLWPLSIGRPTKADIPRCNYCKGPRSYEFQIMPQLLYYFGVRNDPDSLDWGTIVVYTCSGSCDSSVSYKEEFAWVQLYPTCAMP